MNSILNVDLISMPSSSILLLILNILPMLSFEIAKARLLCILWTLFWATETLT